MRRLALVSALCALACSPTVAAVDAAAPDVGVDAGARDAFVVDAGPVVVETFADIGSTTEGIGLGHASDGSSVLYVGASDDTIRQVAADGTVTTFASIGSPVGLAVRADGSLLVCATEGGASVLSLVSPTGVVSTLIAAGPGGEAFGLTNFVAIAPDDSIVFSDSAANRLFRADADGTNVTLVADISYANGLAFSPDGTTLYVASWDTRTLYALSFDTATGAYGTPAAVLSDLANIDGVVTTSTGALALVTSGTGIVLTDPATPTERSELAPRTAIGLPANGVFGDATFGATNLFVTSLARTTIFVVHTDVMAP